MAGARNHLELTPELAEKLIGAVKEFPTFDSACRACRCEPARVAEWLRAGQLPSANALHADFSVRFLAEDAIVQAALAQEARNPDGNNAVTLWKMLEGRVKLDLSSKAVPDARDVATDWLDSCDPELLQLIRASRSLPECITEDTVLRPDVRARLEALGWRPPL